MLIYILFVFVVLRRLMESSLVLSTTQWTLHSHQVIGASRGDRGAASPPPPPLHQTILQIIYLAKEPPSPEAFLPCPKKPIFTQVLKFVYINMCTYMYVHPSIH